MLIKQFSDYALRVLLFVARSGNRKCTGPEIAEYYDISREHLRKVVHKLARHGFLKSMRGRYGGIALARPADKIRVGDVVAAMEKMTIIDCKALECRLLPGCSLKSAFARASRAFIASLNEATLADLLNDRQMKQQFRGVRVVVK